MTNAELIAALRALLIEYMAAHPAFRIKPIGAPNSDARLEQEIAVEREDRALRVTTRAHTALWWNSTRHRSAHDDVMALYERYFPAREMVLGDLIPHEWCRLMGFSPMTNYGWPWSP